MIARTICLLLICVFGHVTCAEDASASVLFVQKEQGALLFEDESVTGTHVGLWVDEAGALGVNSPVVLLDGVTTGQLKINGTDIESFFAAAEASLASLEALANKPWTVELRQALLATTFNTGESTMSKALSDRADAQLGGANSNGWFNFYAAESTPEGPDRVQPLTFNTAGYTNPLNSQVTNSGVFSLETNQYHRPALGAQRVLDQGLETNGLGLNTADNEKENEICVVPAYADWPGWDTAEARTSLIIRWNPVRAQGGLVQFRGHWRNIGGGSDLPFTIMYMGRFYSGDYGVGEEESGDGSGSGGQGGDNKMALLYESAVAATSDAFSFVVRVHYSDNFLFIVSPSEATGTTGALRVAMSRVVPSRFADLRWNFDQIQAIRHGLVGIGMSAHENSQQLPDWFIRANGSDAAHAKCARVGISPATRPDCGTDAMNMGWIVQDRDVLTILLPTPMALSHYIVEGGGMSGAIRNLELVSQPPGFNTSFDWQYLSNLTFDAPAEPKPFLDQWGSAPRSLLTTKMRIGLQQYEAPARLRFEFGLTALMPFAAWGPMSLWNFWGVYDNGNPEQLSSWSLKMLTASDNFGGITRYPNTFVPDRDSAMNRRGLTFLRAPVVGNKQLEPLPSTVSYKPRPDELVVELGRREPSSTVYGITSWLRWSAGAGDWNKQARFNLTVRHVVPKVSCPEASGSASATCGGSLWCVNGACARSSTTQNVYPALTIVVTRSIIDSDPSSPHFIQTIQLPGGNDPGSVSSSAQFSLVPDAVNLPHGPGVSFAFLPVPAADSWATVGVTLSIY